MTTTPEEVKALCAKFRDTFAGLQEEIGKVIVGHREIVDGVLTGLFVGGNILLEGVPGLGKTLLVRTLAESLNLAFSRIQFTPDLMPSDITGTNIVMEDPQTGRRKFEFSKGPVFANIVLADEINRATPKSQSAMLEAMQERSVTVSGTQYKLPAPFLVLATQNPIEQEGTYPLPEAQLDRFLFKLIVGYSKLDELMTIMDRTTGGTTPKVSPRLDGPGIIAGQELVRGVIVAPHVKELAARLVLATHPDNDSAPELTRKYIRVGASPRAAQALILGAKVKALCDGRYHAAYADIDAVAKAALRHRIILNFEAEAEKVNPDDLVGEMLKIVPRVPAKGT